MAPLGLAATELVLAAHNGSGVRSLVPTSPTSGENGTGAEFGKSAPIALVIILLLLVALILLIRSMNRHVKKMPESFDAPPATTLGPTGRSSAPREER